MFVERGGFLGCQQGIKFMRQQTDPSYFVVGPGCACSITIHGHTFPRFVQTMLVHQIAMARTRASTSQIKYLG